MSKDGPHTIVLDASERKILTTAARRHTSPYCDVVRAKAILLAADGMTDRQIGERLELPRPIVAKWRERFARQRLSGLREAPGEQGAEGG